MERENESSKYGGNTVPTMTPIIFWEIPETHSDSAPGPAIIVRDRGMRPVFFCWSVVQGGSARLCANHWKS